MTKISVVIPVYNVEQYLDVCIESVRNQTVPCYEIILVDDGSTDDSGKKCDAWKEKDKRINVIHQENGGLSVARNSGIEAATGDYILFVDSDDTVQNYTCEAFLNKMENRMPDLVVGNVTSFWPNRTNPKWHSLINGVDDISGQDYLRYEYSNKTMYAESVQCLYSVQFLRNNNIRYVPRLLHEDELFIVIAFIKAKHVLPTDIMFYNHMIREGSISTQKDKTPHARSIISICREMDIATKDISGDLKKMIMNHCVNLYYKAYADANLHNTNIKLDNTFLRKYGSSIVNKFRFIIYRISKTLFVKIERKRRKIA